MDFNANCMDSTENITREMLKLVFDCERDTDTRERRRTIIEETVICAEEQADEEQSTDNDDHNNNNNNNNNDNQEQNNNNNDVNTVSSQENLNTQTAARAATSGEIGLDAFIADGLRKIRNGYPIQHDCSHSASAASDFNEPFSVLNLVNMPQSQGLHDHQHHHQHHHHQVDGDECYYPNVYQDEINRALYDNQFWQEQSSEYYDADSNTTDCEMNSYSETSEEDDSKVNSLAYAAMASIAADNYVDHTQLGFVPNEEQLRSVATAGFTKIAGRFFQAQNGMHPDCSPTVPPVNPAFAFNYHQTAATASAAAAAAPATSSANDFIGSDYANALAFATRGIYTQTQFAQNFPTLNGLPAELLQGSLNGANTAVTTISTWLRQVSYYNMALYQRSVAMLQFQQQEAVIAALMRQQSVLTAQQKDAADATNIDTCDDDSDDAPSTAHKPLAIDHKPFNVVEDDDRHKNDDKDKDNDGYRGDNANPTRKRRRRKHTKKCNNNLNETSQANCVNN